MLGSDKLLFTYIFMLVGPFDIALQDLKSYLSWTNVLLVILWILVSCFLLRWQICTFFAKHYPKQSVVFLLMALVCIKFLEEWPALNMFIFFLFVTSMLCLLFPPWSIPIAYFMMELYDVLCKKWFNSK